MAHDLRLAEPGEADRSFAVEPAEPRLDRGRFRQIDATITRRILLEQQLLLDLQAATAADRVHCGRVARRGMAAQGLAPFVHHSASATPDANRSMSSAVTVSVAATTSSSANSARPG